MILVESGHEMPRLITRVRLTVIIRTTEAVEPAAGQVAKRVAAKRKSGQEDDVDDHENRPQSHAELVASVRQEMTATVCGPPKRVERVPSQQEKKCHGRVHEVPVHIL